MRVLFVVYRFPVLTETFILRQVTGLIDRGIELDILALREGDRDDVFADVADYGLRDRVTCIDLPGSRVGRIARRAGMLAAGAVRHPLMAARALNAARCGSAATSLTLTHAARLLAKRPAYDIVHGHFGEIGLFGADCLYTGALRGRLVTTFYGYDTSSYVREAGPRCYRRMWEDGGYGIAICHPMRERLIELGCSPERALLHRVGHGFSIEPPAPRTQTDGPLRLITIARLTGKKGIADALQAIALVRPRFPNLQYDVLGDGPLRAELSALADSLGITDIVRWHGAVEHAAAMQHLRDADIFLLPSVTGPDGDQEGTPLVLIEAAGTQKPALSTQHSGIPEIVEHGETGFLVPEHDPEQLAERLATLLEDGQLRMRMGMAARRHVQARFDTERLSDELVEIYRRIITD